MLNARILAAQCEHAIVARARLQNERISARLLVARWVVAGSMLILGLIMLAGCKCCK